MLINGCSTGHIPIHDKINHELIIKKNIICIGGQNLIDILVK